MSKRAVLAVLLTLGTPAAVRAQQGTVSGVVVASGSRRPLEGVTVAVAGTGLSAVTTSSGAFSIPDVSGSRVTLQVRRLGYRPLHQVVSVGRRVELALTEVGIELDALVVAGTANEVEVRAVGHAVGVIGAREVLDRAPVLEVQQLLQARVPGLTLLPTQGNVGTGGLTQVRGVSSVTLSNEPLIYVDGVRVDNNARAGPNIRNGRQVARINDLNPEDIERVEVIKGPAAAALFGTEASHGVIQILTRRGGDTPPVVSLTVRRGGNWFADPAGRLPIVWGRDSVSGALVGLDIYEREVALGRPIFQVGDVQSFGLSVSGGGSGIRYYLSGAFDGDEGMVWYNWRRRSSVRANVSLVPHQRIALHTSLGFVHNTARLAQAFTEFGVMEQLDWATPELLHTRTRGFLRATPEAVADIDSRFAIDRFIGSVQVRHQPAAWLSQRLTVGLDLGDDISSTLFPRYLNEADCFFHERCVGEKTVDGRRVLLTTFDYGASATVGTVTAWRSVSSIGAQLHGRAVTTTQLECREFPDPSVTTCGGAAETVGSEDHIENRAAGVYVQELLAWQNRMFVTGALRADDHSAFGANFDLVFYPKVAVSWVVHEQASWPLRWVNALKVRAAWGAAGQQPDAFASERSYQPVPGGTVTPANRGNPDLRPERAMELELGLDAELFGERVALSYTHYAQRTRDAIVARAIAPSAGFPGTSLTNVGAVRTSGNEIALDARILSGRAVAWEGGIAYGTNDSRIERLGDPLSVRGNLQHVEGYPVASYFARVVAEASRDSNGVWTILCRNTGNQPPVPCAAAPRVYDGRARPRWEGAVWTAITVFGHLRLYGLVDFKGGHVLQNNALGTSGGATFHNSLAYNDSSDIWLLAYAELSRLQVPETRGLGYQRGGFAKLREVSIQYRVPDGVAARLGVTSATITVAGRNLATLWMEQRRVFGKPVLDPEQHFGDEAGELDSFVRAVLPQYAQVVTTVRLAF